MFELIGGTGQLMFQKVVLELGPTILIIAFVWNTLRRGTWQSFARRVLWTFAIVGAGWLMLLFGVMGLFFSAYY